MIYKAKGGLYMRISTKGRYALRLMVELARNFEKGTFTTIKSIASSQEISEKYLEQIISILHKSELVDSVRGPQGGYKLVKEPKEYSVGEILRIVEGSIAPVYCVEECGEVCDKKEECATVFVWEKIKDAVDNVVDNITLQDIIDRQ